MPATRCETCGRSGDLLETFGELPVAFCAACDRFITLEVEDGRSTGPRDDVELVDETGTYELVADGPETYRVVSHGGS